MPADDQQRKRFEPPPWEQEAFERFERERAERQAQEDLESALQAVRQPVAPSEPVTVAPQGTTEAAGDDAVPSATRAPRPTVVDRQQPGGQSEPPLDPRVDAMLVELRLEEPQAARVNMGLINGVIGLFAVIGLVVVVQAALLFAGARTSEASGTMLAATMSFVVLLAGLGFMAGAVLLFRKYHR
jgi:hypothetical protein